MQQMVDRKMKQIIKGCKPLLCIGDKYFTYHKGMIGIFDSKENKHVSRVEIPLSLGFKVASHFRMLERALRIAPRTADYVDEDTILVAMKGCIYRVSFSDLTMIPEQTLLKGMGSPLIMQRIENLCGFDDGIYYGEYTMNIDKEGVAIFKRGFQTTDWVKVYTFPIGSIHHVHNIIPSKKRNSVYVLTGDDDAGSGIWEASDNFQKMRPILVGAQEYRACVLFESGDDVIYCSDTPMEQNYIYRCKWDEDRLIVIDKYPIPGTCIYGESDGNEILISTSVEPNSIFEKCNPIAILLENRIGDGIKDRFVHVIKGNFQKGFQEIYHSKKDVLPMRLFQFGSVQFSKYSFSKYGKKDFYFEATKGTDNHWYHFMD